MVSKKKSAAQRTVAHRATAHRAATHSTAAHGTVEHKTDVATKPPRRCGGAYQDKGINYSLRISQETLDRIKRITEVLGPRFRSLLGRLPRDSDMARAVVDRGLSVMEREFGIGEGKEGFVLVDSLEEFEEP